MFRMSQEQGDFLVAFRNHVARPASAGIRNRYRIWAELDIFQQSHVVSWTVQFNLGTGDRLASFVKDHSADRDATLKFYRVFGRHRPAKSPACDLGNMPITGN